ncbi:DUF4388 domain-containing protein [candidate division KSB1 bacterium]|nr:DUF4388 domain-containing protein [candidate division KSB1 bacterium]
MAETLAGTISEMSLLEILKLLNSGKMSGRLQIANNIGKGEIFVRQGKIIHCATGTSIGEAAFSNMLGWIEGRFSFETNVDAPEESVETPTDQLLLDGARKMEDWEAIKQVISSMDLVFCLSASSSTGAIKLEPEEWQILAQVNGNRTVSQIVEVTNKDEFSVAKILFHLHSVGLLEKVEKPATSARDTINESFFKEIEDELSKAIGPMALLIIEEVIEDLGETREAFPNDKIAIMIEKVCNEIDDEEKKLQFSQIMIESIKKL